MLASLVLSAFWIGVTSACMAGFSKLTGYSFSKNNLENYYGVDMYSDNGELMDLTTLTDDID